MWLLTFANGKPEENNIIISSKWVKTLLVFTMIKIVLMVGTVNFSSAYSTTDVAQIFLTCCLIDPGKFLSHLSPIFSRLSWLSQQCDPNYFLTSVHTQMADTAQCVNTV